MRALCVLLLSAGFASSLIASNGPPTIIVASPPAALLHYDSGHHSQAGSFGFSFQNLRIPTGQTATYLWQNIGDPPAGTSYPANSVQIDPPGNAPTATGRIFGAGDNLFVACTVSFWNANGTLAGGISYIGDCAA